MDPFVSGSETALDDAIGSRQRSRLAFLLHHSRDTIDTWCRLSLAEDPRGRDRVNPAEEVLAIIRHGADGPSLLRWIADQAGYDLTAQHAPPDREQLPLASATLVEEAVGNLCAELRRRKPRKTCDELRDLRDSITDGLHAAVEREIERREDDR